MAEERSIEGLLRENEELRERLKEAEEVLRAIGRGEVDAIMVTGEQGDQVALILTPATAHSSTRTLRERENSHLVAKSVNVGEIDRILRGRKEFAHEPGEDLNLGKSVKGKLLTELVQGATNNNSTVLLQGETGTGKSMIARWIYEHSNRANAAFVEINCAGLKGDLLANELFGHERGAFTSATESKPGLLDVADGGTLFLDEISDMDLAVQAQFLKVLEEKRYRRLGSVKELKSEFRLICATNQNLNEEMKAGRFRKDLYYRIHVFPIEVPPLRERKEDLSLLAKTILHTLGASGVSIAADARLLLENYSWPGNIRELRNVLERAILLSHGKPLKPEHFPGIQSISESVPPGTSELDMIRFALNKFKGNKRKAAEFLGMSRITLYRRLKQLSSN